MKNMKSSTMKKIVVKCGDFWEDEQDIDSDLFENVYVEAATRSIEKLRNTLGFKVTVLIETWEKKDAKKPDKHYCYNTYFVLINAGMHEKAETLRQNFLRVHHVDLQKESLRGEENDEPIQRLPESGSLGQ